MIINRDNEFTVWQWLLFGIIITGGLIKEYTPVIYFDIFMTVLIIISVFLIFISYTKPYIIQDGMLYKTNYYSKTKSIAIGSINNIVLLNKKAIINTFDNQKLNICFLFGKHKQEFITDIKSTNPNIKFFEN